MKNFLAGRIIYQLVMISIIGTGMMYDCKTKTGIYAEGYTSATTYHTQTYIIVATIPLIHFLPQGDYKCD